MLDVKPTAAVLKASTSINTKGVLQNLGTAPIGKPLPAFAKRKPAPSTATKSAPAKITPATVQAPATLEVAFNPFEMSLQDMVKSKEVASGMSLNDTLNMLHSAVNDAGISIVPRAAAGKKAKKSVRWESDDKLEQKKIVEKLVYGDEFGNEIADSVCFSLGLIVHDQADILNPYLVGLL